MGPATLSGFAIEIDDKTGLATACAPFRQGPHLEPALPAFWSPKASDLIPLPG